MSVAPPLTSLLPVLKQTFGYDSFRPLQQEIIEASLAGRDVFALLPTGGGKSLCFQLPALVRNGLTVVVSPLIALMKDQVNALESAGVAATFLNSTLTEPEARERLRGLHAGRYRLLYAAPERLLLEGWDENLRKWGVSCLAIDEAHCVSEWGHDFRPEYRRMARLRDLLPDVPVIALTATATERVRADIVQQLRLRDPATFVASFNRPNLSYRVIAKEKPLHQIVDFLKSHRQECGIVYCSSRATTERVAAALCKQGFAARPYHAGLAAEERTRNQDEFLKDDTRIVCATIAFGMGINKPNVRWIVHHDLPKNLEGYYQETGRAGRDGLPADCLLLFSAGDVVKQTRFIEELSEQKEREIARSQLRQMVQYAENPGCRRQTLLRYFGEDYREPRCGACDNCLEPRDTYDGTVVAQKFLSCIYRVRQNGRFGVGAGHIIEILTGADTDKMRKWGHDRLSTYGIGRDVSRSHWGAIGRELIQLGLVAVSPGEFATLELTPAGLATLLARTPVRLTRPMGKPVAAAVPRAGEIRCDESLFEKLRALRRRLADERGVPAYIVFGDNTLRAMASTFPATAAAMAGIPGVGDRKLAEFGTLFAEEIAAHVKSRGGPQS